MVQREKLGSLGIAGLFRVTTYVQLLAYAGFDSGVGADVQPRRLPPLYMSNLRGP